MLVSIPSSGEERALKLAQMHPEDENNKEHKDHGLKNNFFSPFFPLLYLFLLEARAVILP